MPEISKVTIPLILFYMYIMPPPTHTHTLIARGKRVNLTLLTIVYGVLNNYLSILSI